MSPWLKWTLIVWLNAVFSCYVAFDAYPHFADRMAVVCGVFSFVVFYVLTDQHLLLEGKDALSKALGLGALLKALTQFYPSLEMLTGMLATAFVHSVMGETVFISVYFITLVDGLLLSLLVAIITLLLSMLLRKVAKA